MEKVNYKRGEHPNCRNSSPFVKGHKINLGRKLFKEHIRKLRLSKLANKNPAFGKHHTEQWKNDMRVKMTGRKHTKETIEIIRGKRDGSNSNFWKGGITPIRNLIRELPEMHIWKGKIMKRDEYTCQECKVRGGKLEVHHIKSFSDIIITNNIKTIEDAKNCIGLWQLLNGEVLCKECHKLTDSFGNNKK